MTKTIIIADDHPFTVDGMKAALSDIHGAIIAATANNGIEAISLIKRVKPDVALLDLSMPGANGMEVFIEGKKWSPRTRFVVITGMTNVAQFKQLKDAGIDGLFIKNSPPEEIRAGVEKILAGRSCYAPQILDMLKEHQDSEQLSNREIEVLQCLARGWSNREIAENLGVSPKTIDSHRTNLLRKMNVNTTAALLVKAMGDGLLTL